MAFNSHQSFQEMDDTCWFRCVFRAFPADNYFLLTLINKASNNDTTRVYQIAFFECTATQLAITVVTPCPQHALSNDGQHMVITTVMEMLCWYTVIVMKMLCWYTVKPTDGSAARSLYMGAYTPKHSLGCVRSPPGCFPPLLFKKVRKQLMQTIAKINKK